MALQIKKLKGKFNGFIEASSTVIDITETPETKEGVRKSELYNSLKNLSKNKLCAIRRACTYVINDKYERRKEPIYGDLPRCLNDEQLYQFFNSIRNPQIKIQFLIQFFYALRRGEINTLRIIPNQNIIQLYNEKNDKYNYLPLYEPIKSFLLKHPYITFNTANYLGKAFRSIRKSAGLNFDYGKSTTGNPIYQFTTHSLRHSAITIFGNYIKDDFKVSKFSRHSLNKLFGEVPTYRHYSMDELRKDLESCMEKYKDLLII